MRHSVRGVWNPDGMPDGHSGTVRQRPRQCPAVSGSVRGSVRGSAAVRPRTAAGGHVGPTPTIPAPTSSWPSSPIAALPVTVSSYRQGMTDMTAVSAQDDRVSAVVAGVRSSAGHPSEASDRRGHQHGRRHQPGHVCRTPAVGTVVISGSGGRSIRRLVIAPQLPRAPTRYNFLRSSSRPACGRPPAAAVLDRQPHTTDTGGTGLTPHRTAGA
jgi:hypothetical protein